MPSENAGRSKQRQLFCWKKNEAVSLDPGRDLMVFLLRHLVLWLDF